MKSITISTLDYERINKIISKGKSLKTVSEKETSALSAELEKANVVEPHEIPDNVVTMNSKVKITFLKTGKQVELKLVYPNKADSNKNRISIFSPIAAGLIGYKEGDTIEWMVPSGPTSIRIDKIIYQPEAAGDFDL